MAQAGGIAPTVDAAAFQQHKEFLQGFFRDEQGAGVAGKLRSMADDAVSKDGSGSEPMRLVVDMNALRRYDPAETMQFIKRPMDYVAAFQEAAAEFLRASGGLDSKMTEKLKKGIQIGLSGSLGNHLVSPRGLLSHFICSLVAVEGIVTKCSLVQPKVVRSVHWCEATKTYSQREYRDATALDLGLESYGGRGRTQTASTYPTQDEHGNPLETEFGLSEYKNHQTVVIQEMPERAPLGQLPRSIEIVLDHDLVDQVKPGDRVVCTGVYRAMGNHQMGTTTGVFKTKVLANNMEVLGADIGGVTLSHDDVATIKELGARPDILSLLGQSFAPAVYGQARIKEALVLQLLGGCEKNLDNGAHLRGDLNILMVGDPSTAKSQLLRAAMGMAPLAVSTTGRGSSGVGLTAAVTSDSETGERKLEAGAMVLADRGLVCIDEFDKMSDADRVALHEVMEQQTVTVAKAGIHAELNARCSVLSAANPVYGQYNKDRRPQDNIGLPDSLLSRFDLLFVVLDQMDPEVDRKISQHVLAGHQYRKPGTDMEPESLNGNSWSAHDKDDADEATPVWNKVQHVLYGSNNSNTQHNKRRKKEAAAAHPEGLLHKDFVKKYLQYAKRLTPALTDGARETIAAEYALLRAKAAETNRTLPVTARQLETLIRVSTAHAKARLSTLVEESDAAAAVDLLQFALYHETGVVDSGSAAGSVSGRAEEEEDSSDDDEENIDPLTGRQKRSRGGSANDAAAAAAPAAADSMEEAEVRGDAEDVGAASSMVVAPGDPRYEALKAAVVDALGEEEELPIAELLERVPSASQDEMMAVLEVMSNENVIMHSEDSVFRI